MSAESVGTAPRYVLLAESLASEIRAGRHPVGTALAGEHALADRHRVSRHTVREALRLLRAQGLVESRHGKGSFVAKPDAAPDFVLAQSIDELFTVHERTRLVDLTVAERIADTGLAKALGCPPGRVFVHVDCVRMLDEDGHVRPISALELFIPPAYGGVIEDARSGTGATQCLPGTASIRARV